MQILFSILLTTALIIFFTHGWPLLPNAYVPSYHLYFIPPAIALLIGSFLATSFTDPGIITAHNVNQALRTYEYDYVLFFPKDCSTCVLPKPARSKHCSLCGHCISRLDHHCVWVNNCIGQRNHRYFLLFISSLVLVCAYGAYLTYGIFQHLIDDRALLGLWVLDGETRVQRRITYYEAFVHLLHTNALLGGLGLFAAIVSVVVGCFTLYQFYAVCSGPTANEACKWDDIREAMDEGRLYRVDRSEPGWEDRAGPQMRPSGDQADTEGDEEGLRQRHSSGQGEEKQGGEEKRMEKKGKEEGKEEEEVVDGGVRVQIREMSSLPRIYELGPWRNLLAVLFPPPLSTTR